MNRRQVLQGMTASLVAALAPDVLISEATAGGLAGQAVDEAGLPAWLEALEAQVARMRARPVSPVARAWYTTFGLRDTAPNDVAELMLCIAAYRDLPAEIQAHPEIQRRMRHLLPRLGQQVLAMTRFLRDLPALSRNKVRQLLSQNPELSEALRHRQRTAMRAAGAPEERVAQIDRLLERLHFRLQRQHPSLLLDEVVDKVRRASADAGVAESEWDELIGTELDANNVEAPPLEVVEASSREAAEPTSRSRKVLRLAGRLAAIGSGLFLLGIGITVIFDSGLVLTVLGGVVLLVSVVLLGVALVIYIVESSDSTITTDDGCRLPDELIAAVRGGEMGLYQPAVAG